MAYYPTYGIRYSPSISLSAINDENPNSKIYFEYTLNGGSITIETRTFNEGLSGSWSEWSEIENSGDSVQNLDGNCSILECRQILETTDITLSPWLEKLYIIINNKFFNNLLESDGSDIAITKSDGYTVCDKELVFSDPIECKGELYFESDRLTNEDSNNNYYYIYFSGSTPLSSENMWGENALLVNHFNESSGNLIDSSIYENDGSINGSITRKYDGKVGTCYDFKGGYIDITASDTILAPDYLTCSAWISVDSISDYDTIIGKGWVGEGYSLRLRTDGRVVFSIHDVDPFADWLEVESDPGTIQPNYYDLDGNLIEYWYKIRGTYDGTNLELMINGVLVNSVDASEITRAKKDQNLGIGAEPGDGYGRTIDGRIDEVRIYDNYLSQEWELTEYRNQNNKDTFYTIQNFEEPD